MKQISLLRSVERIPGRLMAGPLLSGGVIAVTALAVPFVTAWYAREIQPAGTGPR